MFALHKKRFAHQVMLAQLYKVCTSGKMKKLHARRKMFAQTNKVCASRKMFVQTRKVRAS